MWFVGVTTMFFVEFIDVVCLGVFDYCFITFVLPGLSVIWRWHGGACLCFGVYFCFGCLL